MGTPPFYRGIARFFTQSFPNPLQFNLEKSTQDTAFASKRCAIGCSSKEACEIDD
jgi:hypothetical protein